MKKEMTLVAEAILREMSSATRWQTIHEGWQALLTARRIGNGILRETTRTGEMTPEALGRAFGNDIPNAERSEPQEEDG